MLEKRTKENKGKKSPKKVYNIHMCVCVCQKHIEVSQPISYQAQQSKTKC